MANTLALVVHVLVVMTAAGQQSKVIVEMGQSTTLQCDIPTGASAPTTVKWRLKGTTVTDLSTCIIGTASCTDSTTSQYKASVSANKLSLSVSSVKTTETVFMCTDGSDKVLSTITLEVYAWPNQPICVLYSRAGVSGYVEYNCTTDHVYPDVIASLHRKGNEDFIISDFDSFFTKCDKVRENQDGSFAFLCKWRTPIQRFMNGANVYAEMSANVSDLSLVKKSPSISKDLEPSNIGIPRANIQPPCPNGPDVIEGVISIGTQANCMCTVITPGTADEPAEWLTSDGKHVGLPAEYGSSILMLSYNASDPSPTYRCTAIPIHRSTPIYRPFTAKFTDSKKKQTPKSSDASPEHHSTSLPLFTTTATPHNYTVKSTDPKPEDHSTSLPPFTPTATFQKYTANSTGSAPPSGITGLQVLLISLGVLTSLITSTVP